MNTYYKISVCILVGFGLLLFFLSPSLYATTSAIKGTITAKDSGAPLENVKITIVSMQNQTLKYEMETDSNGTFYKSGLTIGMFSITIEKEGYIPVQNSIRLHVAETSEFSTHLETMSGQTPEESRVLIADAQKLLNSGKYDEAIKKLDQVIAKYPDIFILYFNRAVGYEHKNEKEKALADYEKSLQLKPDFLLSLAAVGKLYAKNSNFEKAISFYKKAFDLGINDTVALYNYGACLVNVGNNDEAKKIFEKLISLDANYADAFYQLGIIYLGLNDNAKAKEFLKKFLDLEPENTNAPTAKEILQSLN